MVRNARDLVKAFAASAAILGIGVSYIALESHDVAERAKTAKERAAYFYQSLPQGDRDIVKKYDSDGNTSLNSDEMLALFKDYRLSKR